MTPYARSILKFLSVTYIIGLVGGVYALYTNLPVPHPVYWIVIGLLLVTSVTYSYYNAVGELRDLAGFYRSVGQLKRDAKNTFEELGVKTYLDYYRVRSDDAATRSKLKEKRGVLVVGKPLSGKTRAAIEAINATQPNAFLLRFDSNGARQDPFQAVGRSGIISHARTIISQAPRLRVASRGVSK